VEINHGYRTHYNCARRAHTPAPAFHASGMTYARRDALEDMIEQLIETLDAADGDTDLEDTGAEDDFGDYSLHGDGPGCICADSDQGVDDQEAGYDRKPGDPEDCEEDDHSGLPYDEDSFDMKLGAEETLYHPRYGIDQSSGPMNEQAERLAYYRSLHLGGVE
tara:strand:+ start:2045 stop:2533 length:489 start_codon:yes stop_codon:yes gene_type:complete